MPVYKDKNTNTYYVKYRTKSGKQTTKRGFKSKQDAKKFDLAKQIDKEPNTYPYFHDLCIEYLLYIKNNKEYGTYMKASNFINNFIIPNTSNKRINMIKNLDCLNFRNYVQQLKYSTTYKNDLLARYKQIFKYACKYHDLKSDPSISLDKFKYTREEKQIQRERQMNIWNIDEFNTFLSYVNNNEYKLFFKTLFFTGMRLGECLALTWDKLNLEESYIYIDSSLTRKTSKGQYEIKEPKTVNGIRKISINKGLNDELKNYKDKESQIKGYTIKWFVFGRLKPLPQTSIDNIKNKAIENANKDNKKIKRIRIHDLRHSHASYLISEGVNIVAVSKRLGHKDITTTLETYTHLMQKNDDELIDKLDNMFSKCSHE